MCGALYRSIRKRKNGCHWESLIGYTLDDLMIHLEKQFKNGMSWDNYGEWHIDHIVPIKAFDFANSNDLGFKQCWSLNNLQPLWARDNISKGARVFPSQIAFI